MPCKRPFIVLDLEVRHSNLRVTVELEVSRTSSPCKTRIARDVGLPSGDAILEIRVPCLWSDTTRLRTPYEVRAIAINIAWPLKVGEALLSHIVASTLGILTGTILAVVRALSLMRVEEASYCLRGDYASLVIDRILRFSELQLRRGSRLSRVEQAIQPHVLVVACIVLVVHGLPFRVLRLLSIS